MGAYNYGLGNKDMTRAGHNALLRNHAGRSFSGIDTTSRRWKQFCVWAKAQGIKRMEKIDREDLVRYGVELANRVRAGQMEESTAQNYVSAVNVVLQIARGDQAITVSPTGDCGIERRTGIATVNRAISEAEHRQLQERLPERLGALLDLQRYFGMRFKESALLDARMALKMALLKRVIEIDDGTKGGRPRIVPNLRAEQVEALVRAAAVQDGRSMVPKDARYVDFQRACYREFSGWHGERHAYAQARYEALVGAPCPVVAEVKHGKAHHAFLAERLGLSLKQAKDWDIQQRKIIAEELGHGRVGITNAYLG
ncbi:MAG: integrase domain-containing protein [Methylococcaceae bacterium]|nr:integrase domain-containing protein [Methylococcaceae bacterium]